MSTIKNWANEIVYAATIHLNKDKMDANEMDRNKIYIQNQMDADPKRYRIKQIQKKRPKSFPRKEILLEFKILGIARATS